MTKKLLLFVDDDKVVRLLVQRKWDHYADQFDLMLAEDGVEAVKILQSHSVSLVITDLQMPEMDGFQLLAHLSEHYPDIPVIIQTGYDSPQSRRAVLEGGAVGYVEKPIDVDALVQKSIEALQATVDGGTLQAVPLETFRQLIEMEGKTCTLRVDNRREDGQGALFFKAGVLVDARFGELRGEDAEAAIMSWEQTAFSIQESFQA